MLDGKVLDIDYDLLEVGDIYQKTLTLEQTTLQANEYTGEKIVDLSEILSGETQILSTQFASTGNSFINICINSFTSSTKTFRWSARNLSSDEITFTPMIIILAKNLGGGGN